MILCPWKVTRFGAEAQSEALSDDLKLWITISSCCSAVGSHQQKQFARVVLAPLARLSSRAFQGCNRGLTSRDGDDSTRVELLALLPSSPTRAWPRTIFACPSAPPTGMCPHFTCRWRVSVCVGLAGIRHPRDFITHSLSLSLQKVMSFRPTVERG